MRFVPGQLGTGESYVIDGPGLSHETVMEEPHVHALATALTELLDRAKPSTSARRSSHRLPLDLGRRILTLTIPSTAHAAA